MKDNPHPQNLSSMKTPEINPGEENNGNVWNYANYFYHIVLGRIKDFFICHNETIWWKQLAFFQTLPTLFSWHLTVTHRRDHLIIWIMQKTTWMEKRCWVIFLKSLKEKGKIIGKIIFILIFWRCVCELKPNSPASKVKNNNFWSVSLLGDNLKQASKDAWMSQEINLSLQERLQSGQ